MAEVIPELPSYKRLTLFVPDENDDNSFNDKVRRQNRWHNLDAAYGPFISAMSECLLKSDGDEDYTQHFPAAWSASASLEVIWETNLGHNLSVQLEDCPSWHS